ncbi:hypothetical protein L21SP5_01226 [Salinivirga cyanobacteriivorans]|uniref:Outer membrane protein beta-barrel domain-containing protein n=1 Tax=Salinivirga cyanobacteriivorans TaxID=1307839 RepID=A0A0S2HXS4_9BACT|nr:TonB-dependent receptor [Salinivirga cyanobacteriivorans]ALO14881.1 hypothetical protein L21SP5_01226 [Salinivirga cyanobacteriivorans]
MNNSNKFRIIVLFCLSCILVTTNLKSQVIIGEVYDKQKQPIDFITATICDVEDTVVITGFVSEAHEFNFEISETAPYLIKITRLGYYPYWQRINDKSVDTVKLGKIIMREKAEELEEVTVLSNVPVVEGNSKGFKVNVANTNLKNLETVSEVVASAPGVITDDQGNIEVLGRGSPLVLINNKEMQGGSSVLETYKPEDIKSIQVIKNPGAKYDAKHRSVINIITRKKRTKGIAGWFYNRTLYAENPRNEPSFLLNKYTRKISHMIKAEAGFGDSRYREKANTNISFADTSNFSNIYELDTKGNFNSLDLKYIFGLEMNKQNLLGFGYDGSFGKNNSTGSIESKLQQSDSIYNYATDYEEVEKVNSNAFNINYTYTPDSLTSLLLLADYSGDNSKRENQQMENLETGKINSSYGNEVDYSIASIKADFSSTLKDFFTYETGMKYVKTINDNNSWFDSIFNGTIVSNQQFTKKTQLTEDIGAVYLVVSKNVGRVFVNAGLRSEFNQWRLYENEALLRDSSSIEWFPSASCFYVPFEGLHFGINYARKIKRPGFQSTTRTLTYVNKYLYKKRNPYLKPIIIESFSFQTMAGKNLSLDLNYTNYKNYISLAWENDNNILILSEENFNLQEFSAILNLSIRSKVFSSSNNFQISKPIFDYTYKGEQTKTDIGYDFSTTTKFHLPYDFDWKFIVRYSNKGQMSYITKKPYLYTSTGISKFFLDKQLRFSVYARYWFNEEFSVNYENVVMNSEYIRETPEFYFSIFYKFNKVRNKTNYNLSSQSEEKRRK